MKKIFFAAIAALMMCNLSVKAQDVVDVKSFPIRWGEIASVREIFVPVEGNGLVPSIKEFLIVETEEGVGFLEKNGKGKYFYPCHEVAKKTNTFSIKYR